MISIEHGPSRSPTVPTLWPRAGQLLEHLRGEAGLQRQGVRRVVRVVRLLAGRLALPARHLGGLLRVVAEVDHRGQHLEVDLDLVVAAGRPEDGPSSPSLKTIGGFMVWRTRLPGWRRFGWPGSRWNGVIRLFSTMPVSPAVTPEPNRLLMLWIAETAFPSPSTTQ